MTEYPTEVQRLIDAILSLPGAAACEIGLKNLEEVDTETVSLPGEFADLPQVAIYRTQGGRENEVLVNAEIMFRQNRDGWVALEFLAWWVRDCARSGEAMQLRGVALPPEGFERQLGRTLKFELELFLILESDDMDPVLQKLNQLAESLEEEIGMYDEAIKSPVEPDDDPEIW